MHTLLSHVAQLFRVRDPVYHFLRPDHSVANFRTRSAFVFKSMDTACWWGRAIFCSLYSRCSNRRKRLSNILLEGMFLLCLAPGVASAETYQYQSGTKRFPTAIDACIDYGASNGWDNYPQSNHTVYSAIGGNGATYYNCYFDITDTMTTGGVPQISTVGPVPLARWGEECDNGKVLNARAGECIANCSDINLTLNVTTGVCGSDEQKGLPPKNGCVGNPINIATGNKFQLESDYKSSLKDGLAFHRYYNSLDKVWRHNYSTSLRFSAGSISLVRADGRESFFSVVGNVATSYVDGGVLVNITGTWIYSDPNGEVFKFDSIGRLTESMGVEGSKTYLS